MIENRKVLIAPSILSADFARLGDQIKEAEAGGADLIHIDVMDGHFVPNLTLGPPVVRAVRKVTGLPLDVHLMIDNPENFIDEFAAAGADMISVHVEATKHLHRLVQQIRAADRLVQAGVALNPATPLDDILPILEDIDFALVMSVNPGFAGQNFIPSALEKIGALRARIRERGLGVRIQVDGGIGPSTVRPVVDAGAEILVAGSAVFSSEGVRGAIQNLKEIAAV